MSTPEPPVARPRAQSDHDIPWPQGMIDEPDNCCVAIEVIEAAERDDGDLDVVRTVARVAWGEATATLRELVERTFTVPAPRTLLFEIDSIGWIDPQCPLRLARRLRLGERRLFIEALILPFGEAQAAELSELMRSQSSPAARRNRGLEYARELERRWEQQTPDGRLPVCSLDQDFPVRRAEDAPQHSGEPAAPADEPVPAYR